MWCFGKELGNSILSVPLQKTVSVSTSVVLFPPVLWLAALHIEKLRMWPVTHLSPRVSHCRRWDGNGRDLLGMWTVSPWLTPALITIHHWERARSQAYGFSRPALSSVVKWIIRPSADHKYASRRLEKSQSLRSTDIRDRGWPSCSSKPTELKIFLGVNLMSQVLLHRHQCQTNHLFIFIHVHKT